MKKEVIPPSKESIPIIISSPQQIKSILKECLDENQPTQPILPTREAEFLYSIRELAEFLNCSLSTAQKLKNSGKIRYSQFGRKCVFNSEHIIEDLKKEKLNTIA